MDTDSFFYLLSNFASLSEAFMADAKALLRQEFYKNHQVILGQGNAIHKLWFLRSGFARAYFYDEDGQEHTVKFWRAPEMIFSSTGFYDIPSMEYIEILDDAELLTITYDQLNGLMQRHEEPLALITHFIQVELRKGFDRHRICSLPAEKRYRQFRRDHPEVFKKAPLRIIASYLHMTRESLSRIISREQH